MSCAIHDWYFDTPCPKCVAATVTVTEKSTSGDAPIPEQATPEAIPEEAIPPAPPVGDMPGIPVYLRRNPDNTLVDPTPYGEIKPLVVRTPPPAEDIAEWSDEKLHEALSANLSISERQPILREITRRENKIKTYARLDKAGFTKPKDEDENESDEPE